jgi:hypothetical protein
MNPPQSPHGQARIILWEPWDDPFARLVGSHGEEHEDGGVRTWDHNVFRGPCAMTPLGLVPIHEDSLPSRVFKFWVGHTNFDLTRNVAEAIATEPGVEALDVYSRYRFRVAIARSFNEEAVKKAIAVTVRNPGRGRAPLDALRPIIAFLRKGGGCWALLAFPDGSTQVFRGSGPEEVTSKLSPFKGYATHLVCSWQDDHHDQD